MDRDFPSTRTTSAADRSAREKSDQALRVEIIDGNRKFGLEFLEGHSVEQDRLVGFDGVFRNDHKITLDLLGDVQLTVELEADTAINGFVEIGAGRTTLSPSAVEKYENAAYELAEQALSPDRREALVGCNPTAVTDPACTRAFVTKLGRRAFRRPLSSEEVERYAL